MTNTTVEIRKHSIYVKNIPDTFSLNSNQTYQIKFFTKLSSLLEEKTVAFEGIDGCGKSSLIELFPKYFKDHKGLYITSPEFNTIPEPSHCYQDGGMQVLEAINRLWSTNANDISSLKDVLDLIHEHKVKLKKRYFSRVYSSGVSTIRLCDRGIFSTYIYQARRVEEYKDFYDYANFIANQGLYIQIPDFIVVIKTPLETCFGREMKRIIARNRVNSSESFDIQAEINKNTYLEELYPILFGSKDYENSIIKEIGDKGKRVHYKQECNLEHAPDIWKISLSKKESYLIVLDGSVEQMKVLEQLLLSFEIIMHIEDSINKL